MNMIKRYSCRLMLFSAVSVFVLVLVACVATGSGQEAPNETPQRVVTPPHQTIDVPAPPKGQP
mgnify:CR=1 FL=1